MSTLEVLSFLLAIVGSGWLLSLYGRHERLGYLSMPCVLLLSCATYFLVIPIMVLTSGENYFMGLSISNPVSLLSIVALYVAGGLFGMRHGAKYRARPGRTYMPDAMWHEVGLWGIALVGCGYLVSLGLLQLWPQASGGVQEMQETTLLFVNQALNLLIPLTVVVAVRRRLDTVSILLVVAVLYVLLVSGFRFRMIILLQTPSHAETLEASTRGQKQ